MSDVGDELRAAAEKPDRGSRAAAWAWEHRRTLAPILGVLLGALCPHLGWASGPCVVVGEMVRATMAP